MVLFAESDETRYGRVEKRSPTHTTKNFAEIRGKFLLFRKRFAIISLKGIILMQNYQVKGVLLWQQQDRKGMVMKLEYQWAVI